MSHPVFSDITRIYSTDNEDCDHTDPTKFLENEKQKRLKCNVSVQLCIPDALSFVLKTLKKSNNRV